jgi:hypothetical protein
LGVVQAELPPPHALPRRAEEEQNYSNPSEHCRVIPMLFEKRFRYWEIAGWLSERVVALDRLTGYHL